MKASENVKAIGKGIFRIAAYWGTGYIVAGAIDHVMIGRKGGKLKQFSTICAGLVIADIISDAVVKHTDKAIDTFWDDLNPKKWSAIFDGEGEKHTS